MKIKTEDRANNNNMGYVICTSFFKCMLKVFTKLPRSLFNIILNDLLHFILQIVEELLS